MVRMSNQMSMTQTASTYRLRSNLKHILINIDCTDELNMPSKYNDSVRQKLVGLWLVPLRNNLDIITKFGEGVIHLDICQPIQSHF